MTLLDYQVEVIKSYIAGQFIETDSDFRIDVFNPGTGDIYGQIIESSTRDVNNSVESAKRIFSYWAGIGIDKRCQFLLEFSNEKLRIGGNLILKSYQGDGSSKLKEKFNIRDFHETILKNGTLTLPLLEDQISEYIASSLSKN